MQTMQPWNIKHIAAELQQSYAMCHTETERQCWRYIVAKDCRRILAGRKPTPGEQSILDHFSIHV